MKRVIKFRAYNNFTKEMFPVKMWEGRYIWGFDYEQGDDPHLGCHDTEDNTELMQFTGLKDKNGKKIYEGDILKISSIGVCEIRWAYASWRVYDKYSPQGWNIPNFTCMEVIGNVFENPKLLGRK